MCRVNEGGLCIIAKFYRMFFIGVDSVETNWGGIFADYNRV